MAAARRTTVGLAEGIFFDLPAGRALGRREEPQCALSRNDNSSAHYVAHGLYLRTASSVARCNTCGAPTGLLETWRALSALSFMHALAPGEAPSRPGLYVSKARSQQAGSEIICFTVLDEVGGVTRVSDGSETLIGPDALWQHLHVDAEAASLEVTGSMQHL
jgi:hypothetical protein